METFLKYPGGKNKELKHIIPNLPPYINRYFEPFIGGGAVYLSMDKTLEKHINDKSAELINLYQCIAEQDKEFLALLIEINENLKNIQISVEKYKEILLELYQGFSIEPLQEEILTEAINSITEIFYKDALWKYSYVLKKDKYKEIIKKNLFDKYKKIKKLEQKHGRLEKETDVIDNIETGVYASLYLFLRDLFNFSDEYKLTKGQKAAVYFYIREYCYSSMFRYNKQGKFNVPNGGMSYNHKFMTKKIEYLKDSNLVYFLKKTRIENLDFYDFLNKYKPKECDFIFLDPPYNSEFSTYANNTFELTDQERLANYLLKECKANFMLVIKNTDYIKSLYPNDTMTASGNKLHVSAFDKTYLVSFKNRNNKETEHLLITNYDVKTKDLDELWGL